MTDDQHPLVGRTITGFRTLGPGDGLGRYFNDYALVCVLELDDGTMLGSARAPSSAPADALSLPK